MFYKILRAYFPVLIIHILLVFYFLHIAALSQIHPIYKFIAIFIGGLWILVMSGAMHMGIRNYKSYVRVGAISRMYDDFVKSLVYVFVLAALEVLVNASLPLTQELGEIILLVLRCAVLFVLTTNSPAVFIGTIFYAIDSVLKKRI